MVSSGMTTRLLLLLSLAAAAHDVGGGSHEHAAPAPAAKPRIEDAVRANLYADNWFVLYVNGRIAAVDSIPFIPHNVVSVDLLPEYPMTLAVMARDNAHPATGMEYDNSSIGDGGFILKFSDGTVTSAAWKAKCFSHGPIGGATASPKVRSEPIPENWFATDFDDRAWPQAKEFTEQQVDPKKPFFDHDFKGARWIWSDDLKLDNTVIFRCRIEAPPDGSAVKSWPRGHIVPSATAAPAVENAAVSGKAATLPLARNSRPPLDPAAPPQAKAFAPFAGSLDIKWDDRFVIVGTNAMPDHPMMKGITAWNQQVPLPQDFTGDNAWRIPLQPEPAEHPVSAKTSLFKGAIAVAINGVPIFNPIKQDGRTDTKLAGELDEYGGHAGRADDYHYHLPPTFLNKLVGDAAPIGFAMDGYPLYGFKEPDGSAPQGLDEFNGHDHDERGYHYHSTAAYPYLNGGLRGKAEIRDDQVANQPRTQGIRPFTEPLRGATITGFEKLAANRYRLDYQLDGKTHRIEYTTKENGGADFEFTAPDGSVTRESHEARQGGGRERPRPEPGGKRPRPDGPRPPGGGEPGQGKGRQPGQGADAGAPRTPWILVHAPELDTDKDGSVALTEVLAEARAVFNGYDADHDGNLTETEMVDGKSGVRSALDGFVKQHNLEMDRDRDGKVSAAEMAAQFKRFFDQQDANRDGKLDAAETKVEGETKARFPEKIPGNKEQGSRSPNPRNPNVVFVLVDDMGWNDTGFAGNKMIETPNLDRLARDGFVFTRAYASGPNCAPTRASLMSGQYPPRHGIYTVVDERHAPGSSHHKLLAATSREDLAPETVTLAERFKSAGYATAMFGMWNLGRGRDTPVSPTGQGFDVFKDPKSLGFDKDRYFNDAGEYLTDRFTDEAIAFLGQKRDAPCFIYLAYHAVHAPFEPKPELLEKYRAKGSPDPAHAATVEALDRNIGRLAAVLGDNTVLVFTSDNGGDRRANAPLKAGKGSLYEGGIRVPAFVHGPGIAKGKSSDAPILSMDFHPTLLELAGLPQASGLDGVSFATTLRGGSAPQRDAVFWHFPCYIGGGGPSSAIRRGDLKLIQFFESNTVELYDLKADPGETTDLARRDPDQAKLLLTALQSWQRESGAALVDQPNPAYDPAAQPKRGREERGKGDASK